MACLPSATTASGKGLARTLTATSKYIPIQHQAAVVMCRGNNLRQTATQPRAVARPKTSPDPDIVLQKHGRKMSTRASCYLSLSILRRRTPIDVTARMVCAAENIYHDGGWEADVLEQPGVARHKAGELSGRHGLSVLIRNCYRRLRFESWMHCQQVGLASLTCAVWRFSLFHSHLARRTRMLTSLRCQVINQTKRVEASLCSLEAEPHGRNAGLSRVAQAQKPLMHCSVPPARTASCRMSAFECSSRGLSARRQRTVHLQPFQQLQPVFLPSVDQVHLLRRPAGINLSVIRLLRGVSYMPARVPVNARDTEPMLISAAF